MAQPSASQGSIAPQRVLRRNRTVVVTIFLISLAPILAALVFYLNPQWWPESGSNYGQLIEPQRDVPEAAVLPLATLDGQPFDLRSLKGKWLLAAVDGGACPESCVRKLFIIRNTHASQGKNVERLARVWFITDDAPVPANVLDAYRGTIMVRGRPEQLARFLLGDSAATPATGQANAAALQGPMWVIDPLGHLMLQFPSEADPVKVRTDVSRLVYNSRIG
jgi:hypothetical protein